MGWTKTSEASSGGRSSWVFLCPWWFLFSLILSICLSRSCIASSSVANTLLLYRDVCNFIIIINNITTLRQNRG